ncbi:hypothetical protein [Bradyrhizobium lupini]|uniref:hypothetical protein n=1 Tax=Rhizobium lupini TaxID=136996 RepID=UPI0034C5C4D5
MDAIQICLGMLAGFLALISVSIMAFEFSNLFADYAALRHYDREHDKEGRRK